MISNFSFFNQIYSNWKEMGTNVLMVDRDQYDTNGVDGQMTIFYCGKVNVYDGVPPDKV